MVRIIGDKVRASRNLPQSRGLEAADDHYIVSLTKAI